MRQPVPVHEDDVSFRRLRRVLGFGEAGWTPEQSPAPDAAAAPPGSVVRATPQALLWLVAAGLAVVLAAGYLLSRHHGAAVPLAPSGAAAPRALPSAASAQIVVDVGGRVRHPGLVTLSVGARVADAIAAAGGALHRRDLVAVNLAGRVSDGQLLLIGVPGGAPGGAAAGAGGGLLPLNSATADQLDALPGVGPVLAQRIVSWREQHGGFASVDQLQEVSGIGASKFADLKDLVTV